MQRKAKSSPALAASYNLRDWSKKSGKGPLEPPRLHSIFLHDTEKAIATRRKNLEGQQAWKQLEEDHRGVQAAFTKREKENELIERRNVKRAENKIKQAEMNQYYAEILRQEREKKARRDEEKRIEREEEMQKVQVKYLAAEKEQQRRMPWQCKTCEGSGKCAVCNGKGYHMTHFFVSNLNMVGSINNPLEFGRNTQGCDNCGGHAPGIRAPHRNGDGVCPECEGHGMIWPEYARQIAGQRGLARAPTFARRGSRVDVSSTSPTSPQSPTSPTSVTSGF